MKLIEALDRYADNTGSEEDREAVMVYCHRVAAACLRRQNLQRGTEAGESEYERIRGEAYAAIATLFCSTRSGRTKLAEAWALFRKEACGDKTRALVHLNNFLYALCDSIRSQSCSMSARRSGSCGGT